MQLIAFDPVSFIVENLMFLQCDPANVFGIDPARYAVRRADRLWHETNQMLNRQSPVAVVQTLDLFCIMMYMCCAFTA